MTRNHIGALHVLRARYVEARRRTVLDSLQQDLPSGNCERLTTIQNAIQSVDAAIRDEEVLFALAAYSATTSPAPNTLGSGIVVDNIPQLDAQEGTLLNGAQHSWPSYADWLHSSKPQGKRAHR